MTKTDNNIRNSIYKFLMRQTKKADINYIAEHSISIASDVGLLRAENQDRAVVMKMQRSEDRTIIIGILCDGMGGMKGGAESASIAIASFLEYCILNRLQNVKERLECAALVANKAVYDLFKGDGGCTLVSCIFDSDGGSQAVSIGDSRLYAMNDKGLIQLSTDDTVEGYFKGNADSPQLSNRLLQYVGIGDDIEPHIIDIPDISNISNILITSDDIHYINKTTLEMIIKHESNPYDLSSRLLHLSNWCGGIDNSSLIVFTKLLSLFESPQHVDSGTIQLYDSYGISYLLAVNSFSKKPKLNINKDKLLSVKESKDKEKSAILERNKNKKDQKKNNPQFQIDFENDTKYNPPPQIDI